MNTFAAKVKVGDNCYHPVHEYRDTVKNIFLDDFLNSKAFEEYKEESGRDTISFSKFKEGAFMCPCIRAPKARVCVDEIETGFNELTKSLENILRQQAATEYDCCPACAMETAKKEGNPEGLPSYYLVFACYCILPLT